MKEFFEKTFTELTTPEPLEIHNLGDTPLTTEQLTAMFAVVNYRFENLLPTTTHTDRKPFELCRAISGGNGPDFETLSYAIVGRLWEMGVERSSRAAVQS
ncbi:MAG: hypothetical protein OSJ73_07080 [Lachnospiraceae bacterium]|nr:hypothetical protein [Lachnospiraceae bacterium]